MDESKELFLKNKKIWAVVFLAMVLISVLFLKTSKTTAPTIPSAPTASITLRTTQDRTVYKIGETINIEVLADSNDQLVTGFDVVLRFDPKVVRFDKAVSANPAFDIYTSKSADTVSLTGSLKLDQVPVSVNASLLTVSFRSLTSGDAKITVDFVPGARSDTNLIDEQSHDILTSVTAQSFRIGQSHTLFKARPVRLDNAITAALQSVSLPDPLCRDCIAEATVLYSVQGTNQEIKYAEGGIAGMTGQTDRIHDYIIGLESIGKNYIIITVSKD